MRAARSSQAIGAPNEKCRQVAPAASSYRISLTLSGLRAGFRIMVLGRRLLLLVASSSN
jgi:hypothetical protein